MAAATGFRGFPPEAIEFYEGLEVDNSKEYWLAHKEVYERAVRAPMEALLQELEPEFGAGRMFRPYRDVRFSADKSPYKTYAAGHMERGYLSLSADGLSVAEGLYMPAADQLERFRRAVADDKSGVELLRLKAQAEKAGLEVAGHEELKTAPRGYSKDHPRIDLLRQKGLIAWRQFAPGPSISTKKAKDKVIKTLRDARPLVQWLDKHVGASAMADEGRRR